MVALAMGTPKSGLRQKKLVTALEGNAVIK